MVAGENAETAGIIRDRFVETEFGREIGDRFFDRATGARLPESVLAGEIIAVGVVHLLQLAEEIFVLGDFDEPGLPGKLEHADRVMIGPVPKFWVEVPEQA